MMHSMKRPIIILCAAVACATVFLFWKNWSGFGTSFTDRFSVKIISEPGTPQKNEAVFKDGGNVERSSVRLIDPIPDFTKRITAKPFGIHVAPWQSPIQPERFEGYHTGVDAEILPEEKNKNFFVSAVADGTVIAVRSASGYGGLVVIEHTIKGKKIYGIYGHLRFSSILMKQRDIIKAGDIIGVLGDDKSKETDGERKHLHFGLYKGNLPDIRGYVQTKEELSNWINPLQFFNGIGSLVPLTYS